MLLVPIAAVPAQVVSAVLAGQYCNINVYQKTIGLFCDISVNGTLIIGGVICNNATLIVRDAYLGFTGDLAFFDTQGSADPLYTGLGTRWQLNYLEAWQLR